MFYLQNYRDFTEVKCENHAKSIVNAAAHDEQTSTDRHFILKAIQNQLFLTLNQSRIKYPLDELEHIMSIKNHVINVNCDQSYEMSPNIWHLNLEQTIDIPYLKQFSNENGKPELESYCRK